MIRCMCKLNPPSVLDLTGEPGTGNPSILGASAFLQVVILSLSYPLF